MSEGQKRRVLEQAADDAESESKGKEKKKQVLIGFAAETGQLLESARGKLKKKNLDLIVANDVSQGVFGADSATVHLLRGNSNPITLHEQPKPAIANKILDLAEDLKSQKIVRFVRMSLSLTP